jgi:hypothetical protein
LSHTEHPICLLVAHFEAMLSRHVLNVEVVLEERVGYDSSVIRIGEALCKFTGILIVEQNVDSVESHLFARVLPVSFVPFGLLEVPLDFEASPEAETVTIFPEALRTNLGLHESRVSLRVLALLDDLDIVGINNIISTIDSSVLNLDNLGLVTLDHDPVERCPGIQLLVVVSFKRQPASWSFGRITEFNVGFDKEILNVELFEVNDLVLVLALLDGAELHGCGHLRRRLLLLLDGWWLVPMRIEPGNVR